MSGDVTIVEADLADPAQARDVVAMTAAYAEDVMGNGGALAPEVLDRLVPALREHPTTVVLLAYVGGAAVGIATCFIGFTTFAARPLLNIHDLAVVPEHRGRGVGRALLAAAEEAARRRGCVKLTLEVQQHNARARRVYEAAGFAQAHAGHEAGGALFYARRLD
ncbi:MAG TPA: GNAT family N-acetyltransferase [Polyangia bacterium]|nr:GNAT family N-acetyltransferase [Polyangia bacterium]